MDRKKSANVPLSGTKQVCRNLACDSKKNNKRGEDIKSEQELCKIIQKDDEEYKLSDNWYMVIINPTFVTNSPL